MPGAARRTGRVLRRRVRGRQAVRQQLRLRLQRTLGAAQLRRSRVGALMLLVDDILCSPFSGILWVFREISKIAHEELDGEGQLINEQLRLLYMELETGRITEEQFDAQEKLLLDRLDAIDSRLEDEGEFEDPGTVTTEQEVGNP